MSYELIPTPIDGCFTVVSRVFEDDRGSFTRVLSEPDLVAAGVDFRTSQANVATTATPGTVRGLHAQFAPHGESKLVRCARGSAFDVAVDLRPGSATFGTWFGTEISASNGVGLLVPRGCVHGYQVLEADTTLVYFADAPYAPQAEVIVSPLHELLDIAWPLAVMGLSDKDAQAPTDAPLPSLAVQ